MKDYFYCCEGPLRFKVLPVGEPECLVYPREEKEAVELHQRDASDGYTV